MKLNDRYRSAPCGEVSEKDIDRQIRVAGWVRNIRDHGGVQFVDLCDHTGELQIVLRDDEMLSQIKKEYVVMIDGQVRLRDKETINPKIDTGKLEVKAEKMTVLGACTAQLPFEILGSKEVKEELRLSYRFLDLRNPKVHENIVLRSKVISHLRRKMDDLGFLEIQTPILSASSPEGARDYLIPSRKHPGKFYALPQAPQIFKQLLMVSGFDRYYQIAPCFRDEDARADRSPGEFYQLDFEMAFADQEDVFEVAQEVLRDTFVTFGDKPVTELLFPRYSYAEAMLKFGTDKPDLRNPLEIVDLSDMFLESDFTPFRGKTVRAINVPGAADQPRSFFDRMLTYALDIGMKGLGYFKVDGEMKYHGPIDKFLSVEQRLEMKERADLWPDDLLFFIADEPDTAPVLAGQIRSELGRQLGLLRDAYEFCFVTDFPMYEREEDTERIQFTHNPFSMPQGGLEALEQEDPLSIMAYQYDIVCNGVELSSGAVRNHHLPTLIKAFEIAGYGEEDVKERFSSLYHAFQFGAPPHAGMAPGIDRIVMLLCGEDNLREVVAFPMNSSAQDLLMGAPSPVDERQLREVHIKLRD